MNRGRVSLLEPERTDGERQNAKDASRLLEGRRGGEFFVQQLDKRRVERVRDCHLLDVFLKPESRRKERGVPLVEHSVLFGASARLGAIDGFEKTLREHRGEVFGLHGDHHSLVAGEHRGDALHGPLLNEDGVLALYRSSGDGGQNLREFGGFRRESVLYARERNDNGDTRISSRVVEKRHEERSQHLAGVRVGDGPAGCVVRKFVDENQRFASFEDLLKVLFVGGVEALQITGHVGLQRGSSDLTGEFRPQRVRLQLRSGGNLNRYLLTGDGNHRDLSGFGEQFHGEKVGNCRGDLSTSLGDMQTGYHGVRLASAESGLKPFQKRRRGVATQTGEDVPKNQLHVLSGVGSLVEEGFGVGVDRPGRAAFGAVGVANLSERRREDIQIDISREKVFSRYASVQYSHSFYLPAAHMLKTATGACSAPRTVHEGRSACFSRSRTFHILHQQEEFRNSFEKKSGTLRMVSSLLIMYF